MEPSVAPLKIVIIAVYIPPNYLVARGRACLKYVEQCVLDIKNRYRDPYFVVAGNFNQWDIAEALQEFADLTEIHVGPTRGDRAIDRLFCNMSRRPTDSGTVPDVRKQPESGGLPERRGGGHGRLLPKANNAPEILSLIHI